MNSWKVKFGLVFTILFFIATVVSFVMAWNAPEAQDALSMVTKVMNYRLFLAFLFGTVSLGWMTAKCYQKAISSIYY